MIRDPHHLSSPRLHVEKSKSFGDSIHLSNPALAVMRGSPVLATEVVLDMHVHAFVQESIKCHGRAQPLLGNLPGVLFLGAAKQGWMQRDEGRARLIARGV